VTFDVDTMNALLSWKTENSASADETAKVWRVDTGFYSGGGVLSPWDGTPAQRPTASYVHP